MYIKHGDLVIRNAESADCGQLAAWWNDGKVMAHAGFPNGLGTTPEEIQKTIETDGDDTRRRLIVTYGGKSIGEMSYRNAGNRTAEIGIKICEAAYQDKGLGRFLLSMLIGKLFSIDYRKIILDTNLKNTRAQHVYELLGFRKLRVNIDAWQDQLGRMQSSVDYELTPDGFVDYTALPEQTGKEYRVQSAEYR